MGEDVLVAEAEAAIRDSLEGGATSPDDIETRLRSLNRHLEGPIVGVALLRLLRRGAIELTDDYAFVLPAAVPA
jgi:hypothetical protein